MKKLFFILIFEYLIGMWYVGFFYCSFLNELVVEFFCCYVVLEGLVFICYLLGGGELFIVLY